MTAILKLVPTDPDFVPNRAAQKAAEGAAARLFAKHECRSELFTRLAFIDQGSNLEFIVCPACSARLPLYESAKAIAIREWWLTITDELEKKSAEKVTTSTPCCGEIINVTALRFEAPAAFGRYALCIHDCDGTNVTADHVAEIESLLGCRVRPVFARY